MSLAVLGAEPRFASSQIVNRPHCASRHEFQRRLEGIFERCRFTNNGPLVRELEGRLADAVGVRHCVLTANATLGLVLLARAAGLRGEVLLPSFTFIATANALAWAGLEPVFCDIDPQTWTLDPTACARAVGPRTTAILGVHLFGRPCDVAGLTRVADRHRLVLLFDAAHAFGCRHLGRAVGGFGRAEVFSLHATKALHAFEGGAITTDDTDLAARLRKLRNHGLADLESAEGVGLNAKMSEVHAAMGLTNLDHFDASVEASQDVYSAYRTGLSKVSGIRLRPHDFGSNWHYVVVEVGDLAPLTRDQLLDVLVADGVHARRYFHPGCHSFRVHSGRRLGDLGVTSRVTARTLVLPAGPSLPVAHAMAISELIQLAFERADEVKASLVHQPARTA